MAATFLSTHQTIPTGWGQFKLGAGGLISKCSTSPDGTIVIGTDTYGAYIYDRAVQGGGNAGGQGKWRQLISETSVNLIWGYLDPTAYGFGTVDIKISQQDSNIIYLATNGYFWRSADRGTTWTKKTAYNSGARDLSQINIAADSSRYQGEFIAVDPVNDNVVFVSSRTYGISYTTDGGGSWTPVSSGQIPATATHYSIAFDPSTSSGGNTKGIYIGSDGSGVYHTSDYTGGTWALTTSSPTGINCLAVSSAGVPLLAPTSGGELWKYASGSWTKKLSSGVKWVSFDPANPTHAYVSTSANSAAYRYSSDAGSTWSDGLQSSTEVANDIPWITACGGFGSARYFFDPLIPTRMYACGGLGVYRTTASADGTTPITWEWHSAGLDNLTTNWGVHVPNGNFVGCFYDRSVFSVAANAIYEKQLYPTTFYPAGTFGFGWSCDHGASTNTVVVLVSGVITGGDVERSGVSQDGGKTFTQFPTTPPYLTTGAGGGDGGVICASAGDPNNFVMVRCDYNNFVNTNSIYYTKNAGQTWIACTYTGHPAIPTIGGTGWGGAPYTLQQLMCADRVLPGVFYAANNGWGRLLSAASYNSGTGVVTLTLTGGDVGTVATGDPITVSGMAGTGSFAAANVTTTLSAGSTSSTLKYTIATGLTLTFDYSGAYADLSAGGKGIWKSTDGGVTWALVSQDITSVGIECRMLAVPGQAGHLFYTPGGAINDSMKRSTNGGVTWTSVTNTLTVWCFGFGPIKSGQSYPSVYFFGTYSGVVGLWRSYDNFSTVERLGTGAPGGRLDSPIVIVPDPNVYGLVRFGWKGSAFVQGYFP